MNKLLLIILTAFTFNASAQNWSAPVQVESFGGTGGEVGLHTALLIVNGNPAIAYYDKTHESLMFVRASDASGFLWSTPVVVDSIGNVGEFPSLQIVNGYPAISYYDNSNGDLKYVRANDADGTSWPTPMAIDVTSDVGQFTSMEIVNGNPAIAYRAAGAQNDLKYIRAADSDGAVWSSPTTVDLTTLYVVGYISLKIVNSFPAISYCTLNTIYSVNFIRATNFNGTSWAPRETINPGVDGGSYASMEVVNGTPAIAYFNRATLDLDYARATDASGTTWAAPINLDAAGVVGEYSSLKIVDGHPAVSYFDGTNTNLKYVRANDISGTNWASPISIDVTDDVGQYTSLYMVNSNPAISYYDLTNGNLKYVWSTNTIGSAWSTPVSFDENGDVGQFTSLQILNGNPAISYYDNSNDDLKFVRANDASGLTWAQPVGVDVAGNVGQYTCMQIVNGNPAISYLDVTNQNLKYVRADDAVGTTWSAPVVVDFIGSVGQYNSMQIVNGFPAISYYDNSNDALKFVRATNALGTAWSTPITIDINSNVGQYTSLQIVNGNPAVSYYDFTNGDLKFIRANDPSGASWAAPSSIDVNGDVGKFTSLQVVDGNPAIAYFDVTNLDLKYVRATDASGSVWSIPVSIDVASNSGQYSCLQIINGNPAISYYESGTNRDLKYVRAADASGAIWPAAVILDSSPISGITGEFTSMMSMGNGAGIAYYNRGEAFPYFILGIFPCNNPDVPAISATDTVICSGNTVTLSITTGALNDASDWQWYSNSCGGVSEGSGTSINVAPTSTTTYYVRGEGGCVVTSICGDFTVSVNNASSNSISPTSCDSYTLNAITYTTSGTYIQNLTNAEGCDSVLTINLTIDTVDVSTTTAGITISATTSFGSYQWLDCNNGYSIISGETNQSYTPISNGNYAVEITQNGCVDTSSCINIFSVGLNEMNQSDISIYPNPFQTRTTIDFGTLRINSNVKIIDLLGKEIKSINFTGKQLVIERSEMQAGIYFVVVTEEKKNTSIKRLMIR